MVPGIDRTPWPAVATFHNYVFPQHGIEVADVVAAVVLPSKTCNAPRIDPSSAPLYTSPLTGTQILSAQFKFLDEDKIALTSAGRIYLYRPRFVVASIHLNEDDGGERVRVLAAEDSDIGVEASRAKIENIFGVLRRQACMARLFGVPQADYGSAMVLEAFVCNRSCTSCACPECGPSVYGTSC